MRKCRFFAAILSLIVALAALCPAAMALEQPELSAKAALLMDAKYDQVLYEKNADTRLEPASLTKVMTAMLVLEAVDAGQLSMSQEITVRSVYHQGSYYGFEVGDKLRVEDLLYCMMVSSANDAASILARTVDEDEETFAARMNAKAAELGCTNTNFVNPHGMPVEGHYSTARDMYLIARKAMEHETFRTIVATKQYTMPAIPKSDGSGETESRKIYNTNALLSNWHFGSDYLYSKAIGIKTGTASGNNYCLLSAAQDEEQYLICVVLEAPMVPLDNGKNDRRQFSESRQLLDWGFNNFSRREIVDTVTPIAQVGVTLSATEHVLVRPEAQLERTLPNDMDTDKVVRTIQLDSDSVDAPVEEGQVLGKLVLTYEGETLGAVNLVAVRTVERSALLYRLNQIKKLLCHPIVRIVAAVAVVAIVVLVLRKILTPSRRNRYGSKRYSGRRNYRGRRR